MLTAYREIDGLTFPAFILSEHKLRYRNLEWDEPQDGPFTLELPNPCVALISADDGRGTTDGSPNYRKFLAISQTQGRRVITAYLAYTYTGPVEVKAWKPELKDLLADIDMEHFDITPDRVPDRLLERHQERISGKTDLVREGLRDLAQQTFHDMLWNVANF